MTTNQSVRVWDLGIRVFHWSLVIAFTVAYVTGEDEDAVHVYAGYFIVGLLAYRLLWGFIGTKYARFRSFLFGPRETIDYLTGMVRGRSKHYLGHNPAGGAMVYLLLFSLAAAVYTGLEAYGAEGKGPLAALSVPAIQSAHADEHEGRGTGDEFWEEAHELFSHLSLVLVVLHILGVLVSSKLEGQNLVRAMITGRKLDRE